ncbi:MAG TPA: hypothetical protein VEX87_20625 [Skermanella sp.]|nr:hypothetical protein [Skermanella sp.]
MERWSFATRAREIDSMMTKPRASFTPNFAFWKLLNGFIVPGFPVIVIACFGGHTKSRTSEPPVGGWLLFGSDWTREDAQDMPKKD